MLAEQNDIEESTLAESIIETFKHRGTGFDNIIAFTEEFYDDPMHQTRWKAFVKKKRALIKTELPEVVAQIKRLTLPIIEDINTENIQNRRWNPASERWE